MQSPPLEWTLGIGHLVILNLLRDAGPPDSDTISENVRPWAEEHPAAFAALCVGVPAWFWCHIQKHKYHLEDRAVRLLDGLRR